jgi:type I restriction enzyme R subunit
VEHVTEAISKGQQRILLTLATGTGKTFIAFQIAWKLFYSRWNLSRQPLRRPRILFLADRNILANQAFNAFSAFPEDAMARIKPEEIRKRGNVPKNASLFVTIFQTFMSGPPNEGKPSPYFGEYPPDFFDFIIIDECHRGGANDESNWRGILEYFAPAVQLGLTATPKRQENADTYAYFGEPAYIYSLKDGINDGFLSPFRVKQIATTLDEYVYTPDDKIIDGEVETGKRYTEADFNRIIEIKEREKYRVKLFMEQIDQREKTLVFCASQDHARAVRDLVNQMKASRDPDYCHRVTARDGELGEQHLRDFQDNEKSTPTILTTSQKLSTGVDARNIRNIVLMRPINSMIEFKQIIGRGTRLYDGKDYFTIYDFVKAHQHFSDPEWDGEPMAPEPCATCGFHPCQCVALPPQPCPDCGMRPCECPKTPCDVCGQIPCECPKRSRAKVKLADGKERALQHMLCTTFWHPDGTPMSAQQFMEALFGKLPEFFKSEEELRAIWSVPDTRKKLLQGLSEHGIGPEQLQEMQHIINAEKSDIFDVLAYVAYALPPITREERADGARVKIVATFTSKQRAFLEFVLAHYVSEGVEELDQEKLIPLLRLKYDNSIHDAMSDVGPAGEIGRVFAGFQQYLYQQQASSSAESHSL